MSRTQYLAALSLGIVWIALTACRNSASDPERGISRSVEGLGGHLVVAPRRTGGNGATLGELERAVAGRPRDARLLNDLAAAYFVRAHKTDHPEDLVRALDVFAKAHAADPSLPEARFNLALTLERLHLIRLAQKSWNDFLDLNEGSYWDREAELHLKELTRPSASEQWSSLIPELEKAALRGDQDLLRRFVKISPQSAREYALETLLGGWGDAVQAGDRETATRRLRIASEIGEALRSVNSDETVRLSVAAIERASEDPARLKALATGYREFREAMNAYRPLRTGDAAIHFAAAQKALAKSGSPVEQWAACGLARCWGYEGRYDEGIQAYKAILANPTSRGFFSLTGWTQWGWAWISARQGRPMETLSRTKAMEEAYEKAGDSENLGAARFLISESLFLLGQRESGWRYDYSALEALSVLPMVFRRHVLLTATSTDALDEGLPEASLLMLDEALRVARETQDPIRLTETHKARAKVLAVLQRNDEALVELDIAKRAATKAPQDSTGRKLRADLLWAEGEIWLLQDPRRALEPLSEAIREYGALNAFAAVAYTSLARAKVYQALRSDQEAEADLETALHILEDPAMKVSEEDLLLSYADSIENAYDQVIGFQWEHHQSCLGSLQVLERSRSLFAGSGKDYPPLDLLPQNGVVVEYALLRDRLLTWVVDRHGCRSFEKRVRISDVDFLVESFLQDLKKGSDEEGVQRLSAKLHDLLIPTSIDGLPQDQIVYFVPDKSLNKVPYAALWNRRSNRYFIQDHPLAISPSLKDLLQAREPSRPATSKGIETVLLVGNPTFDRSLFPGLGDLPDAKTEILAAQRSFGDSQVLTEGQGTKPQILDRLDQFDAFVFAGHAVSNLSFPSQSYLVLAPSSDPPDAGVLLAKEIQARKFQRLRLVVLSACSSIGPRSARASGLTGIARPFLSAGVSSVVGTLWNVHDQENATVLPELYRRVADGDPPTYALRAMQLASISGKNPLRAWSSFEIITGRISPRER
jgi:CHAT domain-containing protein